MMETFFTPPKGFYNSTIDWARDNQRAILFLKQIYPKHPMPINIKKTRLPAKIPGYSEKMHVLCHPGGRVWGEHGAVITNDNYLLMDQSFEWLRTSPADHSVFLLERMPEISYLDCTAAILSHSVSGNYYHWMFEVLPRLELLKKSDIEINKFIVSDFSKSFQRDSIKGLGMSEEDIIPCSKETHIQVKNLVVPSVIRYPNYHACQFLRNSLLPQITKKKNQKKRIYIRRKWSREIVNEYEILGLLYQYGFECFELESLSLLEQIELFSNSEMVVATHGAGLTNLVFCSPGTKVIELFSPSYIEPHYMMISEFCYLRYHFILGECVKNPYYFGIEWEGFDNVKVQPEQLKKILKETY